MTSTAQDKFILPTATPIISSLNSYSGYLCIFGAMGYDLLYVLDIMINVYALQDHIFNNCGMGFGLSCNVNVFEDENIFEISVCKRSNISSEGSKILEHFSNFLRKKNYIIALVDTVNIEYYDIVKLHPLLIFGVNNKERSFYVCDNFKDGLFGYKEISFESLINALSYPELKTKNFKEFNEIKFVKSRFLNIYSNDLNERLKNRLLTYLNKVKNTSYYYNIHLYEYLFIYLSHIEKNPRLIIDVRKFSFFSDHKKIIQIAITNYVNDIANKEVCIKTDKLFFNSRLLVQLIMVYKIIQRMVYLQKALDILKTMQQLECEIFGSLQK